MGGLAASPGSPSSPGNTSGIPLLGRPGPEPRGDHLSGPGGTCRSSHPVRRIWPTGNTSARAHHTPRTRRKSERHQRYSEASRRDLIDYFHMADSQANRRSSTFSRTMRKCSTRSSASPTGRRRSVRSLKVSAAESRHSSTSSTASPCCNPGTRDRRRRRTGHNGRQVSNSLTAFPPSACSVTCSSSRVNSSRESTSTWTRTSPTPTPKVWLGASRCRTASPACSQQPLLLSCRSRSSGL